MRAAPSIAAVLVGLVILAPEECRDPQIVLGGVRGARCDGAVAQLLTAGTGEAQGSLVACREQVDQPGELCVSELV